MFRNPCGMTVLANSASEHPVRGETNESRYAGSTARMQSCCHRQDSPIDDNLCVVRPVTLPLFWLLSKNLGRCEDQP